MSIVRFLVAWPNAPFTIAIGIAILFALLQATGILGLLAGGGEGDADHEMDHDVDADHEVDGDPDADGDHDGDQDADQEAEGRGIGDIVFGTLGVGKIPFSIIWQAFAVVFGVTGLAVNSKVFAHASGTPLSALLISAPIAIVVAYTFVALLARALGPILSNEQSSATSRAELVGEAGIVISSSVTEAFGEVRIRDKTGHDVRVVCKLAKGVRVPTEHERVVVVDYEGGDLRVAPMDEDEPPKRIASR